MTTNFLKTTGIPLYKIEGESFCKMIDVLKMIHHEGYEAEDKTIRRILDRMEMRLTKNDFMIADAQKPTVLQEKGMIGRYAVGHEKDGKWEFYVGDREQKPCFSDRPCMAKLYATYRDASACADFLDDGEWDVLDFYDNMSEEDRWQRELRMPFPYDADEGNENAIPVQVVT